MYNPMLKNTKWRIASVGVLGLVSFYAANPTRAIAADENSPTAAAENNPVTATTNDNDEPNRGFYIRSQGFAILDVASMGKLSNYKKDINPTLTTTATGDSLLLNRTTGYGGGFMAGYNFGSVFIGGGYDRSEQKFTANDAAKTSGEIKNNMMMFEVGTRLGGSQSLPGLTFATQYGLNMLRVEGLTNEEAKGDDDDDGHHKDKGIKFVQHNAIAMLQLDMTLFDFVSFGAFGKYYYGFATKNKDYKLSAEQTVTVGGFLSLVF